MSDGSVGEKPDEPPFDCVVLTADEEKKNNYPKTKLEFYLGIVWKKKKSELCFNLKRRRQSSLDTTHGHLFLSIWNGLLTWISNRSLKYTHTHTMSNLSGFKWVNRDLELNFDSHCSNLVRT